MANLFSELTIKISVKPDATLNGTLKSVKDQIDKTSGALTDMATKGSLAFAAIGAGLGLTIKGWLDLAGAMEQYRAKLVTVLKDVGLANETIQFAVQYAAKTPFDVQGVVDAATQLTVYGQRAQAVLPLVGDLAAGMGKELNQTALSFGKAMSGSYEGFERLRNEYGITTMKLKEYGGAVDKTGQLQLGTADGLRKTQEALEKIVRTEFGGAVERQANTFKGAMSNLADATARLGTALGEELVPAATKVVRAVTAIAETIEKTPKILKVAAAGGAVLAFALSGTASAAMGLMAVLPHVSAGWQLINSAAGQGIVVQSASTFSFATNTVAMKANMLVMKGYPPVIAKMGAALAGLSPAFIAIAGAGAIVAGALLIATHLQEEHTKKLEATIQRDEKALRAMRTAVRQYVGQTAEDLMRMGVTAKDIDAQIQDLSAGMIAAVKDENYQLANTYKGVLQQLRDKQVEIKRLEGIYGDLNNVLKQTADQYKVLSDSGSFRTSADEVIFLKDKMQDLYMVMMQTTLMSSNDITPNLDFKKVEDIRTRLVEVGNAISRLEQKKATSGGNSPVVDFQINSLKALEKVLDQYLKATVKANDDSINASEKYLSQRKKLNQLDINEEIRANERILAEMRKKGTETKKITDQIYKIEELKYEKTKQAWKSNAQGLKDELESVRNSADGQIAAYQALIDKIREYQTAGKITDVESKKLQKDAAKELARAEKDATRARYDEAINEQEKYLIKIENNEDISAGQRVLIYRSLILEWQNAEKKKLVSHKQAADQIVKITEKQAAEEKRIIEANRNADKSIRNMHRDMLSGDISGLADKAKAGESVENKIIEKVKQRTALELQSINEQRTEWEKQGWTKERIESGIALLKEKAYRDELESLDQVIAKIKQAKEERDGRKGGLMSLDQYLQYQNNLFYKNKPDETADMDVSRLESARKRTGKLAEDARKDREVEVKAVAALTNMTAPVDKFDLAVNTFRLAVELQKNLNSGVKLSPEKYSLMTGSTSISKVNSNQSNAVYVTVNDGKSNNNRVNVTRDETATTIRVRNMLKSEVAPLGFGFNPT